MLAWGVSGYQLGFPQQVAALMQWLNPGVIEQPRAGVLGFFRDVHFARIGEGPVARWVWTVLSLLPTLLLISGIVVWWRRVVRGRWLRRSTRAAATRPSQAALD